MTETKPRIAELIERVKKASTVREKRVLDVEILTRIGSYTRDDTYSGVFNAPDRDTTYKVDPSLEDLQYHCELPSPTMSADAALALFRARFPNAGIMIDMNWRCDLPEGHGSVYMIERQYGEPKWSSEAEGPSLPQNIVLALLKAVEAEGVE